MEYRGYIIDREKTGKYGTSIQYRCGRFVAPRKRDVVNYIDQLLERRVMIDLELDALKKAIDK